MQQHSTALTKTACISALIIGVLSAAFAFSTKTPTYAVTAGSMAIIIGLISLFMEKNIDDMQLAAAGIFMAVVACLVGLWQLYN